MQKSKISLVIFIALLAGLLSGCTSGEATKTGWPQSFVDGGVIYTSSGQHVYAVNVETGAEIWRFPEKPDGTKIYAAAPILMDGNLIVGGFDGQLHSINPKDGKEIWLNTDAKESWIAAPLVFDGLILAPNADSYLYALNSNGAVQWKFKAENGLWTTPVTDGNSVFVTSMDKHLYSIDPKNGKSNWSVELGGSVLNSLAISDDGVLYVGTISNEILAVSADSGKIIWRVPTGGTIWEPVVIQDGTLYAGDQSGKVSAFSTENGNKLWEFDAGAPVIGGPVLTDAGLFIGTGHINSSDSGEAIQLTTSGAKDRSQSVDGKLYSRPVVAGNLVVFGVFEGDKTLTALDNEGRIVWSFTPSK